MIGVGLIFKKLGSLSGLGAIDRIFGFIFGASKFFFITAVIAHAAYNIKAVKSVLDDTSLENSVLLPVLIKTGSIIMKIDPIEISNDINETTKSIQDEAEKMIEKSTKNIAQDAINKIKETMPEKTKNIQIKKESEK